jgi:hypothetical protein
MVSALKFAGRIIALYLLLLNQYLFRVLLVGLIVSQLKHQVSEFKWWSLKP